MKGKLLLIEDDAEIARIIRDTLMLDGYMVTWATTGLEGWEDFQQGQYDLVLIDWMLPEMDGLAVCQNIRWVSEVPILMISARKEEADKVEGLQGADDYLAKPFSLAELKARVASHLRRWHRYNQKELEIHVAHYEHGLTIHWEQQRVRLGGVEINLTQKEFDLLVLLAHNPQTVFTKEQLYEHVWQQPSGLDTHTVTVHVKALREKLQDSVKTPRWIQTVWGKGYRFIGERI